jgi:hypothetical protein
MSISARFRFMLSKISRIHLFQLITGKSARSGTANASTFRRLMSLISRRDGNHRLNCTSSVWNGVPGIGNQQMTSMVG